MSDLVIDFSTGTVAVEGSAWIVSGTYDNAVEFTSEDTWNYVQTLNGTAISSGEAVFQASPGEGYMLMAQTQGDLALVVMQSEDGTMRMWQDIICSSDEPEPANPNYVVTFSKQS